MTEAPSPAVEARIDRLHAHGVVDMHFDMLMDLYDKRDRAGVLEARRASQRGIRDAEGQGPG